MIDSLEAGYRVMFLTNRAEILLAKEITMCTLPEKKIEKAP